MRGRLAGVVAMLGLALLAPVASAAICTVAGPYGNVQYQCDGGSGGAAKSSDPWWASPTTQAIVAFVGLAGSAIAGGYALYRVRARRKALTDAILSIERAYSETKGSPETGIPRLVALRQDFRALHQKGKLDDGHFLELDKRATEHIVRLRVLDLDRRFLGLPPGLMAEVRRLVGDGHVSQEDVDLVERHAAAFRVPEPRRGELVGLVRSWCTDDGAAEASAEPLPAHKLLVR